MLSSENVATIFVLLNEAYSEFAERHGSAFVKTSAMVDEIATAAATKARGAFTREQVLEVWTCVLVSEALFASGALPKHEQN